MPQTLKQGLTVLDSPENERKTNNMGATSLTREQLNEAINQFADKIMDALGATVTDEAEAEPELTGTKFQARNEDGDLITVDSAAFTLGTLIVVGAVEYFRASTGRVLWVCYDGEQVTDEEFARRMRNSFHAPRIAHRG